MKKVAAATLGCKVNYYETEAILSMFSDNGYEIVDFDTIADIYIINTCAVTNLGVKKSRQTIRRARTKNPNAVIAAVGCYTQVSPGDAKMIDGVNIVLGSNDRKGILAAVEQYMADSADINGVTDIFKEREYEPLNLTRYSDRQRVYVKIQDGCDRFCSYCIIPYARGPVRSRSITDIVEETENIAAKGFKEIVLTGIHLASYGKDLKGGECLITAIESAHMVKGVERIRLGSLEPTIINADFVRRLQSLPKVCQHFHLSLQSGSDKILRSMNRRYRASEFLAAAELLKSTFPDSSITTDMIVGFPGETDEDFDESRRFAETIGFMKIHVFPFSEKKGTAAEKMRDKIPKSIKNERAAVMLGVSDKLGEQFFLGQSGKTASVLFEQILPDGSVFGYTGNYVAVRADGTEALIGHIVNVKLHHSGVEYMKCEIL